MAARGKCSLELGECAVRMYRTSAPEPQIEKLAVGLGVHPEALRGWSCRAGADDGERDDRLTTDERAELAALRCARRTPSSSGERSPVDGFGVFRGAVRLDPVRVTTLVDEHCTRS